MASPKKIGSESEQQFSIVNESGHSESNLHKSVVPSSDGKKIFAAECPRDGSSDPGANKLVPEQLKEDLPEKRQKMDHSMTTQCSALLQKLMRHRFGWVFNVPVDPVILNIPDYFSVISEPMDLGTIKSKLEKNMYLDTQEFAADIRLTFSNATTYNPPSNDVYVMAEVLKDVFDVRWKSLMENIES